MKVLGGYRSTDAATVEAFVRRLREAGLEACLDRWEIRAGDDIVARMDEGLDGCDAAPIFTFEAWFDGSLADASISASR
ncbi:MAG: toll/interleukin-1 receptor domain-containing protein [Actinobacteria bacterium]|nr:toll/interleukin-1 receptor domain-containing protein [Actinomycetota bacterium]